MGRLFFSRSSHPEPVRPDPPASPLEFESIAAAMLKAQSITASAIFAALVGKGVLTADEAGAHMREIAQALAIDVPSPIGKDASRMLDSYRRALGEALG